MNEEKVIEAFYLAVKNNFPLNYTYLSFTKIDKNTAYVKHEVGMRVNYRVAFMKVNVKP